MAKSFLAQVKDANTKTKADLVYVATAAIQDVIERIQTPQQSVKITGGSFEVGKMPVDTKELIESLSVDGGATGPAAYVLALADLEIGDVMAFEWTAPHALPMETGYTKKRADGSTYTVKGRHMVGANAPLFSDFVAQRSKEVDQG